MMFCFFVLCGVLFRHSRTLRSAHNTYILTPLLNVLEMLMPLTVLVPVALLLPEMVLLSAALVLLPSLLLLTALFSWWRRSYCSFPSSCILIFIPVCAPFLLLIHMWILWLPTAPSPIINLDGQLLINWAAKNVFEMPPAASNVDSDVKIL